MTETIVSVTEREPAAFHPSDSIGLSVRLSFATDEVNKAAARAQFALFLQQAGAKLGPDPQRFAVYRLAAADRLDRIDPNAVEVWTELHSPTLTARLQQWLDDYGKGTGAFFTTPILTPGIEVERSDGTADAHDVLLGVASAPAPLPQALHLSFVLRIRLGAGGANKDDVLLVVPWLFDNEEPAASYDNIDPEMLEAGEVSDRYIRTAPASRHWSGTVARELKTLPSTLIDPETGFCRRDQAADVYPALRRFEQRAGSQFNALLAAGEIPWPAEGAEQGLVRRLAWRAVMSLAVALDTCLIALAMPGRPSRDGAIAGLVLDRIVGAVEQGITGKLFTNTVVPPGFRASLRNALRSGVAKLPLVQTRPGASAADRATRTVFAQSLRDIYMPTPASLPGSIEQCGDWLTALLCGYRDCDATDTWKTVSAQWSRLAPKENAGNANAITADQQTRELERELASLLDTLTGEVGLERSLMRLLGNTTVVDELAKVLTALLTFDMKADALSAVLTFKKADEVASQAVAAHAFVRMVLAAVEKALPDFSTADAMRQTVGSLLSDLLIVSGSGAGGQSLQNLQTAAEGWAFWQRRFGCYIAPVGAEPAPIAAVVDALAQPLRDPAPFFATTAEGLPDESALAVEAIRKGADAMQSAALAMLFPVAGARFVPDTTPQPLAMQISIDPAADDADVIDDFSAAFAGVALLLKQGSAPWSHANLAELVEPVDISVANPYGVARIPDVPGFSILPIPTTVDDGRRNLFISYDGLPFASLAFDDSLPDLPERPMPALFLTDYPDAPGSYAPLPRLAYGTSFAALAFALGRAGSLPWQLQTRSAGGPDRRWPWRAAPHADPGNAPPSTFGYSRMTAIGRTSIRDTDTSRRIGQIPDGVRPLCADYPALQLVGGTAPAAFLDVFRNSDGSGSIALPEKGSTVVELRDLTLWGGTAAVLVVQCLSAADTVQPPAAGTQHSLDLPVGYCGALRLEFTRLADGSAEVHVSAGTGQPLAVAGAPQPVGGTAVWVRLGFDNAAAGVNLSLADPTGEQRGGEAASMPAQANLLLLGAETNAGKSRRLWREPYNAPARLTIEFPRVTYVDFERWTNNDTLRQREFAGLLPPDVALFRERLLAAYIGRNADLELAQLLDRLPDPAVAELRLHVGMLDGLRDAKPALARAPVFAGGTHPLPMPRLGEVLSKIPALADVLQGTRTLSSGQTGIKAVLLHVDAAYRRPLQVHALEADAAPVSWWTVIGGADALRVPAGIVAQLTARPLVERHFFDATVGGAAIIDARLLQYALSDTGPAAEHVQFDGACLQIETMTGPLQAEEGTKAANAQWFTTRAQWARLARKVVEHDAPLLARRYSLTSRPGLADDAVWRWRQLGSIDVETQRWRFLGRPIYSWPALRDVPTRKPRHASFEVPEGEESIPAFESEAFLARPDLDCDREMAQLLPVDGETRLIDVVWEAPSATWFRHRLTLRSRYAGAMTDAGSGICRAWSDGAPWRRIVMLGQRGQIELQRPQLRALIPLTTSPDANGVPPVAAVLQETAFGRGGLAERIGAEIVMATGYGFNTGVAVPQVVPQDLRAEYGPDPVLSYVPAPDAQSTCALLAAEGPMGLTFDSPSGYGQGFPNQVLLLHPQRLASVGDGVTALPLAAEEHFFSVSLRRHLDPDWLVDETDALEVTTKGRSPELDSAACWHEFDGDLGRIELIGAAQTTAVWAERAGSTLTVWMHNSVIDETAAGVAAAPARLCLCTIPDAFDGMNQPRCRLAFLHQRLDPRRRSLAVYLCPKSQLSVSGNAPLLLASMQWSIPEALGAVRVEFSPGEPLRPVNASQTTTLNWTRTNRNFDVVHADDNGKVGLISCSGVEARLQKSGNGSSTLYFQRTDATPARTLWLHAHQRATTHPGHAQRHLAVLLSQTYSGLGRSIVQPVAIHVLGDRESLLELGQIEAHQVNVIEFEVPAVVLGHIDGVRVPEAYRFARFDLLACGYDNCLARLRGNGGPAQATAINFSFFVRFIGSSSTRKALRKIDLRLGGENPTSDVKFPDVQLLLEKPDSVAHVLQFDLELSADGKVGAKRTRWCYETGASEPASLQLVNEQIFAPGQPVQSAVNLHIDSMSFEPGTPPGAEVWLEIGLLIAAQRDSSPHCGFSGHFDFDWCFGRAESIDVKIATSEPNLRTMQEAQARVIAASPPIPIKAM